LSILTFTEQTLYAGASWSWTESLDDYAASDGWALSIYLKHKTDSTVTLTSTASGDDFVFDIGTATTSALSEGNYRYQAVAARSGEVEIVEEGYIDIKALLTADDDTRSDNEIILDAIIATLKGRATKEQESIQFAGRTIAYLSLEELINAKKYFEKEVAKDKRTAAGKSAPRILEEY